MTRLREVSGTQEWLYVIIAGALALYLVIGVIAWSWMILVGRPAPSGFTTLLAAIVGAMAGILSPLRPPGSHGRPD
jgi:hypothetical protein